MISQVGNYKVLITESIKKKMLSDNNLLDQKQVDKAITQLFNINQAYFNEEILVFNISGEEAREALIELLQHYVSGSRGLLIKDNENSKIYWLKIWINGNLFMRLTKLSDYVEIKIDFDEIEKIVGEVDRFEIYFKNGSKLSCDTSIRIS